MKTIGVFGSYVRGEQKLSSDVDILVEFSTPPNFDIFIDVKSYLEDLLGGKVDLVMPQSIRPQVRPFIEQDLIYVA